MPRLVIIKGGKPYTELILPGEDIITIGRAEANDIVLPDSSLRVSRYHAALIRLKGEGIAYFIRDLASLHATKVDGEVVSQKLLCEGSTIEIGDYSLRYSSHMRPDRTWREGQDLIRVRKNRQHTQEAWAPSPAQEKTTVAVQDDAAEMLLHLPKQREVAEVLRGKLRSESTPSEVFDQLMEPILRVLPADRGFVGLFRKTDSESYQGVGIQGFDPKYGECIEVDDDEFLQRLRRGDVTHESNTLLVPFFVDGDRGFICVDRKQPGQPFATQDVQFLVALARILAQPRRVRTRQQELPFPQDDAQDIFAWPETIVGSRKRLQSVFDQIRDAASSDGNVLILGETGTGKGVVARAIHGKSERQNKSFVNVDLPSIPETLAESELFGHKRGAFSGAVRDKKGRFELADKGTIFLDEIGVLLKTLQFKLLKPIAEKVITCLGDEEERRVDVRVIAATNKDLAHEVAQGNFADDLYRRLRGMEIRLSPLRERREDIPLLVHYFLDKYAWQERKRTRGISRTALQRLSEYHWPGNIRELEGYMQAAVARNNEVLFSWDFPPEIQQVNLEPREQKSADRVLEGEKEQRQTEQPQIKSRPKTLKQMEQEHICEVLEYTKGNKTAACKFLGCSRQTLLTKMKDYKMPREYGQIG